MPDRARGMLQLTRKVVLLAPALPLAGACAGPRPAQLPVREPFVVTVKSARIPDSKPIVAQLAQHMWIDLKDGSEERWRRYEIRSATSGIVVEALAAAEARADRRWGREVTLLKVVADERAREVIQEIDRIVASYDDAATYRAWPGPNSNTFIARTVREIPALATELHHNAIGKDYTPFLRAGGTCTRTGLEVETLVLGLQLGLIEGFELHIIQFTIGLRLFPPALKLPFVPLLGFR